MLSASAKQIGMRQDASVRVKQSKSQQIVANADPNAPTRIVMSIRGQFEWTGCGLKLAARILEHQHGPTGVAHLIRRPWIRLLISSNFARFAGLYSRRQRMRVS
jgi:hypothetical protein